MLFTGTYEHSIDSKNRLSIPIDIRMELDRERDGTYLVVTLGQHPKTLRLYTERRFRELCSQLPTGLLLHDVEYNHNALFFGLAKFLDFDKQGRVLLPDYLLDLTGIRGEVVLAGCGDHLVIWKKEDYRAFLEKAWQDYPKMRQQVLEQLREQNANGNGQATLGP